MKHFATPFFLLCAASLAAPAIAQGQIGTVERGLYACELPGTAAGAVGIAQPDENFTILSASRYSSPQGEGTYLRRGNRLTMTSGPRNGNSYAIQSNGFLRKIENGEPGRLRCIRQTG
ncbi:elongation factor P [Aurantiacibacter sp. MUD61]|uniref:elongation factor P n=1 Tax=Aurantiacibacter sp. MUD61 TaxID=3009083 RepID=UPI0022F002F1|nr:elongation factor P [Aurantiacibacter sp. MUD61]